MLMNLRSLPPRDGIARFSVLFSKADAYYNSELDSVPLFILMETLGQAAELVYTQQTQGVYFLTKIEDAEICLQGSPSLNGYIVEVEQKSSLFGYCKSICRMIDEHGVAASGTFTHFRG